MARPAWGYGADAPVTAVMKAKQRRDSDLSAPTISLPFGMGGWTDTDERRIERLGPCATCGRSFEHRYRWGKDAYCACHYYRARLESEAAVGREADRRDRERLRRAG